MSHLDRDPWVDVKTYNGFQADHVISALQKEIRRGNEENAALLAYEMIVTSPALAIAIGTKLRWGVPINDSPTSALFRVAA